MKNEAEEDKVFIDFANSFEKQNKFLKLMGMIIICILTFIVFLSRQNKQIFVLKNMNLLTVDASREEACYWGISSLFKQVENSPFVDETLLKSIRSSNINIVNILGEAKTYNRPLIIEEALKNKHGIPHDLCRIKIKTTKGVKFLDVEIVKDKKFPFGYGVYDFDEIKILKGNE